MTVFLVDLEAVETRYTAQWKSHVPKLLTEAGHIVRTIAGPTDIPSATTPGAFLNFGGTNIYKASQVQEIGRLFTDGVVSEGDHFLFTDAWHPGIINLKYMSELLRIPVKIHALWHAGSYDPQDFLGRLIGDAPWVRHAEKAFFEAIDYNYFATDFHVDMFAFNLYKARKSTFGNKIVRSGWPMEYMAETLKPYAGLPKRDLILFPHRIAPEKQVNIFRHLATELPEYEFVVCQDQELTKEEYHTLLGQSKIVFSANLQETLGISCYEGMLVGAIPLVPDRLSYKEMYGSLFKYPSEWTESWDSYYLHKEDLKARIREHMENFDARHDFVRSNAEHLTQEFFSATKILETISGKSLRED
jgi:hypothetical protein